MRRALSSTTCSWLKCVQGRSRPSSPRRKVATEQRFQWRRSMFENDSQTSRSVCAEPAEKACSLRRPTISALSACISPTASASHAGERAAPTPSPLIEPGTPDAVLDFCPISTGVKISYPAAAERGAHAGRNSSVFCRESDRETSSKLQVQSSKLKAKALNFEL